MTVKTIHGDVYLARIKVLDVINGDKVYFGSDLRAAIKAFDDYEEECEGDWIPEIKMYYYDVLTRHAVGYKKINYSVLTSLVNTKSITIE